MAFSKQMSDVTFEGVIGEMTKATSAWEMQVNISGDFWTDTSMDLAAMFSADWWPAVAKDWLTRQRNWPSKDVIEELSQSSYIIAKPSHGDRDRLDSVEGSNSFHAVEASLAQLRSPNQKFIYLVFKSLIYKYIKPIGTDKIPSFWGKNIMLWFTEHHGDDDTFWLYLVECVQKLLSSLLESIREKKLDYFFIPQVNVMETLPSGV